MNKSIKIIILGDTNVGKTSLVYRLTHNEFLENGYNTIGAAFSSVKYDNIRYDIWDTAGQERYLSLIPIYLRNSNIQIIVFDCSNLQTLDRLDYYVNKINEYNPQKKNKIILLANKIDLISEEDKLKIKILIENTQKKIDEEFSVLDISVKTNHNIYALIELIKNNGSILNKILFEQKNNIIKLDSIEHNNNICPC